MQAVRTSTGYKHMTKQEVQTLLMDSLGLKKEPVALKPLKEIPSDIPAYDGLATPGYVHRSTKFLLKGRFFIVKRKITSVSKGLSQPVYAMLTGRSIARL